jgi:fructosamine-3-kinase
MVWFVVVGHPLLESNLKSAIESAASRHLGRRWVSHAFTDLNERASHPCGVLHGEPFSVFAKLDIGDNAEEKLQAELSGLTLLRDRARIAIPTPIGSGLLQLDHGSLLLTEALSERPPWDRTPDNWRAIGHTLATVHRVHGGRFGLENFDGFFGPLPQDNKPVTSNRWVDFHSERRVIPLLRSVVDSGHLQKILRVTCNASFIDCYRSAVQSHNRHCFTATPNNTTSSAPMSARGSRCRAVVGGQNLGRLPNQRS